MTEFYEIGITGTEGGATVRQLSVALELVKNCWLNRGAIRIHEGDCIGFDEQLTTQVLLWRTASNLSSEFVQICGHPPTNEAKRAHVHCDIEQPPAGYLARDRVIVQHAKRDLVIAAPKSLTYVTRGGTNYTTKYAVDRDRAIVKVVLSTGTIISGADFVRR